MSATPPPAPIFDPPRPSGATRRTRWQALPGAAQALAIAALAEGHPGLVVVLGRDVASSHRLEAELGVFLPRDLPVLHFPDWEVLPYDIYSPVADLVSQRIATLNRLPTTTRGVLVLPAATAMQRLAPRSWVLGTQVDFRVGERLDLGEQRRRFDAAGYRHVPQVLEPGDYATRGALLDVFPMGAAEPYRIELFDDTIETIRTFDPETQRSAARVEAVRLLAGREVPTTDAAAKRLRAALRERFDIDPRRCPVYQDVAEGVAPAGIESYLPLYFDATETIFDYFGGNALLVLEAGALVAAEQFFTQTGERFEQRRHDRERPVLPPDELYLPPAQLREALNRLPRIEIDDGGGRADIPVHPLGATPMPSVAADPRAADPLGGLREHAARFDGRTLVALDSAGRREALAEQLRAAGIEAAVVAGWREFLAADARLALTVAPLEDGFVLESERLAVIAERQLLGERVAQRRRRKRAARDPEAIVRDLAELAIGAPVVHVDHGVGRYQGLVRLDLGGVDGEFLAIEYAKGDRLYVPVAQLDLVSRYTGAPPEMAPLHSLGGDAWERAKRKAAQRVRDVAAELLEIHARRESRPGIALTLDRALLDQFAAAFPFEETPDQQAAIEAVLADLEAPRAMDRVVCGDVGFGKTEVALRAAFAVATAGRQVAVLVPTTLLAEQHFRNFTDRLADWPVKVEVLSRFRGKRETAEALARIAEGKVDIVIGTHRLLGEDVRFRDLGLVIVDEEQRFGVRQKEQLKKLRAEVDLLTLTATPIPRTLNMAMAGLRDLSIIATPPANRLAVQTFITPWEPALIREAFQRELGRGGQVYFLHNDVASIERMARELEALLPEARIRIAHGQMPERELETVMRDFYRQRFNVLVCSTIIESGIDVPNANTIIIHRADRFGLAQLHQLRGRVGRSHHRAYAYLIVPDRKAMTADAEKRLEALASLDELGAGFALATHDLEIRGAGELLGEEQSGQIEEVGFSLYSEMLARAVRAMKAGKLPDEAEDDRAHTEVELHLPALLPDDYLPDVHQRLVLYKRIAGAGDADALTELKVELIDRFGPLPEPAQHLFAVQALRQRAAALGIRRLELGASGGRVLFGPATTVDPLTVIRLVQRLPKVYALDGPDKLKIRVELPGAAERIRVAGEILDVLARPPAG
jgi:transcription-repair coupling factor (superfamily II helicase)